MQLGAHVLVWQKLAGARDQLHFGGTLTNSAQFASFSTEAYSQPLYLLLSCPLQF